MSRCSLLGSIVALALATTLASAPARAEQVSSYGAIVRMVSYSNYGGGDVVVFVSSTHSTCNDGYWVSPSQAGYKTILAHLMVAKASGESLIFWADNAVRWPGSSGAYCRIESVG